MKYALSQIFGNCINVKIIEVLAENYDNLISRADVSRITGIPKSTVGRHFKRLLEEEIIKNTGEKYRKASLYQMNLENELAVHIVTLQNLIVTDMLEKKLESIGELTITKEYGELILNKNDYKTESYEEMTTHLDDIYSSIPTIPQESVYDYVGGQNKEKGDIYEAARAN